MLKLKVSGPSAISSSNNVIVIVFSLSPTAKLMEPSCIPRKSLPSDATPSADPFVVLNSTVTACVAGLFNLSVITAFPSFQKPQRHQHIQPLVVRQQP